MECISDPVGDHVDRTMSIGAGPYPENILTDEHHHADIDDECQNIAMVLCNLVNRQ